MLDFLKDLQASIPLNTFASTPEDAQEPLLMPLFIRGAGTYSEARLAHYLSLCKLQQRAQRGRHPLSL